MDENKGFRIKFMNHGDLMVSYRIFTSGNKMVRLTVDPTKMEFQIIDPATGFVYVKGGNVSNYEVLLRKAKRELKKFLGVNFGKETRKQKSVSVESV
jgi:hypothetical protein